MSNSAVQEKSAQYILSGDINEAEAKISLIKFINEFKTKLASLGEEWKTKTNIEVKYSCEKKNNSVPSSRSPHTGLLVKLPNGDMINESTAAATFARTIKELGIDNVNRLGITVCNWQLISSKKHPNSQYRQQLIDGVLVMPPHSTKHKKKLLEEIARKLNVNIAVSVTQ